MWNWQTEGAWAAIRGGHSAISRVDVLHGGRVVYTLEVVSGTVSMKTNRSVQSNLACTLVDATGNLTTGDVEDLLDPYECEIAPHRGVEFTVVTASAILTPNAGFGLAPFGTSGFGGGDSATAYTSRVESELAPLGVFGLTSRQVADDGEGLVIRLTGQDRAMGYQVPLDSALAIPGATPVETAILRLLSAANPMVTVLTMDTGRTCGPLLFQPDIDVWAEAQELAESVGARLYHDRTGQCVLAPMGPPSSSPAASYREGDGLLLSLDRAEDSDTIRNVVVAESTNGLIRAVVRDDDPTSPTYYRGRYGSRPAETVINQHFQSVSQAQQAASARLVYELGRSETVTFTAVPDPGLDVEDVVMLHRPRAGLTERALVVDSVDIPLSAEDAMQVECRKSVLTMDGEVLEDVA